MSGSWWSVCDATWFMDSSGGRDGDGGGDEGRAAHDAVGDHLADEEERGCFDLLVADEALGGGEGAGHHTLVRGGGALDERDRGRRIAAVPHQRSRDRAHTLHAHVDDDRLRGSRERGPVSA